MDVKNRMKAGTKLVILLSLAVICLSACTTTKPLEPTGGEKQSTAEETTEETTLVETETQGTIEPDTTEAQKPIEYDIEARLNKAEADAAALEKKWMEDASIKQTDMNRLSGQVYQVWDDVLNELWQVLKENLDDSTMDMLLQEQRTWITNKEDEVKKAAATFNGGSMAAFAANQKAAELTKTRVYELASYLG